MTAPCFFGYGSLVNRATHDYPAARPARLQGWRRVWRHTGLREVAFLSVAPSTGSVIDGLVAQVPGNDWQALDQRECAYARKDATAQVLHDLPDRPHIAVYEVEQPSAPGNLRHPILLSYLDVVVQGFLREFGEPGVAGFFASTDGWEAPVLADRDAPRYPRHQPLTQDEKALVDDHLHRVKARLIRA